MHHLYPSMPFAFALPEGWLGDLGSWASIISFGVTVYVAYRVRRIAQVYRELALVPLFHDQLAARLKNLTTCLTRKAWDRCQREAATIAALTEQVVQNTDVGIRSSAKEVLTITLRVTTTNVTQDDIQLLIVSLTKLVTHLATSKESSKWR